MKCNVMKCTLMDILVGILIWSRSGEFGRKNVIRVFVWIRNYVCQIHGLKKEEKRKVTFRIGENETEIDFVLIKKEHQLFIQNVKAIPEEFQHALAIADIDKNKIMKVVR